MRLDFAVVGFQKCGTASVRRWLRDHPEVACAEGEVGLGIVSPPWGPDRTTGSEFLDALAGQPNPAKTIGVVDPTYSLCDVAANAESLFRLYPSLKVITIERNAVERAFSAWKMASLAGWEDRSLVDAISSCLVDGPSWTADNWLRQSYVEAGEYDRLESIWSERFEVTRLKLHEKEAIPRVLADALSIEPIGEFPHENGPGSYV